LQIQAFTSERQQQIAPDNEGTRIAPATYWQNILSFRYSHPVVAANTQSRFFIKPNFPYQAHVDGDEPSAPIAFVMMVLAMFSFSNGKVFKSRGGGAAHQIARENQPAVSTHAQLTTIIDPPMVKTLNVFTNPTRISAQTISKDRSECLCVTLPLRNCSLPVIQLKDVPADNLPGTPKSRAGLIDPLFSLLKATASYTAEPL
jgi:hypothetical protein